MLSVVNLTKYYKNHLALDEVSFTVADGEIVGLLGPNGAGKTTALRCITSIVQRTTGDISVDGYNLAAQENEVKRRLAFVPEVPNPYEMLTVLEHVRFIAMAYDTLPVFEQMHESLLKRFDLYDRRNDLVMGLSKGMRQKLAIVCAFIHDAGTFLFDEPLIGIDPKGAHELKEMMLDAKSRGKAVLISTHMLDTAERLCDRIIILKEGRILAEGTVKQLLDSASMGRDASLEEVFLTLTEGGEPSDESDSVPSL